MSDIEVIKDIAKQALTLRTAGAVSSVFFWDRAQRFIRSSEFICRLPELEAICNQIDAFSLVVAALFVESGVVRDIYSKTGASGVYRSEDKGKNLLDVSCRIVEERLADVLESAKIRNINRVILESNNRSTTVAEAMVLSDACNLDDMGAVGILCELKQCIGNGRSVSGMLKIWKRKIDYQYWQARLQKSFHFDSVRQIAEQRLSFAQLFMNQLEMENSACDLIETVEDMDSAALSE